MGRVMRTWPAEPEWTNGLYRIRQPPPRILLLVATAAYTRGGREPQTLLSAWADADATLCFCICTAADCAKCCWWRCFFLQ